MKNVRINSSYGFLSANIAEPNDQISKAVIIMPGFLNSKDHFDMLEMIQFLSANGYLALSFDTTGIWASEGDNQHYSISQYLKDLENVIRWIKNKYKNVNEVSIGGHSLGGLVAMLYAAKNDGINKVFALMSPSYFPGNEWMASKLPDWKAKGVKHSSRISHEGEDVDFFVPYSFVEDAQKYSSVSFADIKIPKLFVAGEQDHVNTPELIKSIYDSVDEPKLYAVIKGAIHGYREQPAKVIAINKLVLDFLETKY